MTVPSVSLELHRAIVRLNERTGADLLATNAALAQRVTELESALDAAQDDAARFRELVEAVEWMTTNAAVWSECVWCRGSYPIHKPDCARQAVLAQTQAAEAMERR